MTDILSAGDDNPRPRPPRWLVVVGIVLLAAGVLAAVLLVGDQRGPDPATTTTSTTTSPTATVAAPTGPACETADPAERTAEVVPDTVAGLVIEPVRLAPAMTLERRDRSALQGPWTVVVRRVGGSLGRHGAVVTFPVGAPTASHTVKVGDAVGKAGRGQVVWPLAGGVRPNPQ